ncbi:MAG: hypothetical protein ACFB9N_17085 [Geitlerinemataceae cyanobacterium]
MAIFLLFVIALINIIVHRFAIEIPIDLLANIDIPLWVGGAMLVLLLSWLLEDDRPDWL